MSEHNLWLISGPATRHRQLSRGELSVAARENLINDNFSWKSLARKISRKFDVKSEKFPFCFGRPPGLNKVRIYLTFLPVSGNVQARKFFTQMKHSRKDPRSRSSLYVKTRIFYFPKFSLFWIFLLLRFGAFLLLRRSQRGKNFQKLTKKTFREQNFPIAEEIFSGKFCVKAIKFFGRKICRNWFAELFPEYSNFVCVEKVSNFISASRAHEKFY